MTWRVTTASDVPTGGASEWAFDGLGVALSGAAIEDTEAKGR